MKRTFIRILCAMLFAAMACSRAAAEENALFKELTETGVKLANGKTVKLPPPVMADGLTAKDQADKLKDVGPKNPGQLKSFVDGKRRDWYEIPMASEKGANANDPIGRRVDLYFVARGKLETVASPGYVKAQIEANKEAGANPNSANPDGQKTEDDKKSAEKKEDSGDQPAPAGNQEKKAPQKGTIEFYTPDELKTRKLSEVDKPNLKERYAHALLELLDKVQVGGSGYGIETIAPDSVIVAFKLDPRFDKDPQFPNQWRPIIIDAAGKKTFGDSHPYSGFGGYAKFTRLAPEAVTQISPTAEKVDRIFVEYHYIFDEPHDWFNGTSALVSKLDQGVYQDAVPKFRKNISDYEKAHPAAPAPADKK
jgi:hypothetical protein